MGVYHNKNTNMRTQEEELEWWEELTALANKEDPIEFFRYYAKYLKDSNLISNQRRILYRMVKKLVEDYDEGGIPDGAL